MRVDEVMSQAKCCRSEQSARDCARMMRDADIGFVPVCDAGGKPVGAVTDRDLAIRVLAEGRSGDDRIERFMTHEIVSCTLDDEVERAAELMRVRQVSRVMVCDADGRLQGVLSLQDIAELESDAATGHTLTEVKSDHGSAAHH
jgi:CBS domain-containing protein